MDEMTVAPRFPELIPEGYPERRDVAEMTRTVRETPGEYGADPEALADPIGEEALLALPHLVRKYRDRALYLATTECVVHCRFCFRRALIPRTPAPAADSLSSSCAWVAAHPEISEVILSGGDPLALGNEALGEILRAFGSVPTVEKLRIHTRAPVVTPSRVDAGLLRTLGESAKPLSVVLHVAHPAELTSRVGATIEDIQRVSRTVTAQTVLLKGVNADPRTLAELFSGLGARGVTPRYLHHPDRVAGGRSFRVAMREGLEIVRRAAASLGDAMPPYVVDLPDGSGKTPVSSLRESGLESFGEGVRRRYRWERPEGWSGVSGARSCEWWDIAEPL